MSACHSASPHKDKPRSSAHGPQRERALSESDKGADIKEQEWHACCRLDDIYRKPFLSMEWKGIYLNSAEFVVLNSAFLECFFQNFNKYIDNLNNKENVFVTTTKMLEIFGGKVLIKMTGNILNGLKDRCVLELSCFLKKQKTKRNLI